MRAAIATALAAALAVGAGVPSRAQEKAGPPKAASKPAASFLTGAVEALDEAKGTLTVKSRRGVVKDFVAEEKAREQLKGLRIGDRVVVKHLDGAALSIVKPGVKKREAPPKDIPPKDGKAPPLKP